MDDGEVSSMLASGSREDRFLACRDIAFALASAGCAERALRLAERGFNIWLGDDGFIDEYLALLKSVGDAAQIRRVAKRAGIWHTEHGTIGDAIAYFNIHQYAEQSTGSGDRYCQNHEVLHAVEMLAGVTGSSLPRRRYVGDGRIRIAYLVYGAAHTSSVLVRLALDFVKYHDQQRFECAFFAPDPDTPPSTPVNIELFRAAGEELCMIKSFDSETCLIETAAAIDRFKPDILVSLAALADYRHYFLFAKCPAVARVSLCYGPPAQFVPPKADMAISATRHPLMDCPCDGAVVALDATLPARPAAIRRSETVSNKVTILAAGRSEKFLDRKYWETILGVLAQFPHTRFLAVGIESPPEFLQELLATQPGERVEVYGWLNGYHDLLSQADIVLDTFPSGGGLTVLDSMAFGIPVLTFANDYLVAYDQSNWNPAEEFLCEPLLVVRRGDFSAFAARLGELIVDRSLRVRLGAEGEIRVREAHGNPARMIRRIESHYAQVLKRVTGE